ncbi:MAG: hypothetical protein ACK5Y2_03835 [Bdellovibrionales bacterium]
MTPPKSLWFLTVILGLILGVSLSQSQSSVEFKKEQEIIRVQMVQLSRELGVTCTECHSQKNWKDDAKPSFKTARQHLQVVEVLRQNGLDGKKGPEASCFMCHQGRLRFAHKMQHPESLPKSEKISP